MRQEFNYVGERIKKAREAKAITMEELGVRADVSGQHIGLLERGRSGISIHTLVKIANALEVTTDSLLVRDNEPETISYRFRDTLDFLLDGFTEDEMHFIIKFIRLYREEHQSAKQDKNNG